MSDIKIGDRVKFVGDYNSFNYNKDEVYTVTGVDVFSRGFYLDGKNTHVDPDNLILVPRNRTLDDLRKVVDSLRAQGYDVDPINVTEPAVQHTI